MKTFFVAGRLMRQIGGDKRTLALLLIAPVMILFILKTVLSSSPETPKYDAINVPDAIIDNLRDDAVVTTQTDESIAKDNLKSGKTDAYIIYNKEDGQEKMTLVVEGSTPSVTELAVRVFNTAVSEYTKDKMKDIKLPSLPAGMKVSIDIPKMPEISVERLYTNEDYEFFDYIAPLLMGFIIFFLVFLLAGISFLRERISGTLERLMATSIHRSHIVLGYFLGFGFFAALQTIIIQLSMKYILNMQSTGSFLEILTINLLIAATSLSLGTLLSAFAKNEFQLFQFIPVIIIPQILFSGLFPLDEAPLWVIVLSKIFPLSYAADALKNVMLRGIGLGGNIGDLFILAGFALVFLLLNMLALRKYRRE